MCVCVCVDLSIPISAALLLFRVLSQAGADLICWEWGANLKPPSTGRWSIRFWLGRLYP